MKPDAFSKDGFLINQPHMGDEPYGYSNSARSGCGWIAAYNVLKLHGETPSPEAIRKELLGRSAFRGLFGTSPFALLRFFRRRCPGTRLFFGRKKARLNALAAPTGVILYRHREGLHYVAYQRLDSERARFFNAVSGEEQDELAVDAFLRTRCVGHLVAVYSIPEAL